MPIVRKRRRRRMRQWVPAVTFLIFAVILAGTHALFLDLPFHWDEMGQFVPAALDLYEHGALVPISTTPNVHPPGLPLYLAAVWKIFGFSILSTRLAMLALGAAALAAMFLLGIEYCRDVPGIPAVLGTVALCASPVFFMQSMMAQLDMPAMLLGMIVMLLFLDERYGWAAAVSVALVMVKETGALFPLVLGVVLVAERRREAIYFAAPFAALAVWIVYLTAKTGHPLGNAEFAAYNVEYLASPLRMGFAFTKRLYNAFFENFHWIGMIGVFWGAWLTDVYLDRRWRIAGALIIVHVLAFSVAGGAMLERYLLPVYPLLYLAMIAGWSSCPNPGRTFGTVVLLGGLAVSNFWNPPYPFPYENSLAMIDFVRLQQRAAEYIETRQPNARVVTIWPMSIALRRPEFGYVKAGRPVLEIADFTMNSVRSVKAAQADVAVFFPREWDPPGSLMSVEALDKMRRKIYGYEPPVGGGDLEAEWGMRVAQSYARGGQWLEVYVVDPKSPRRDGK